jgi:hypothetical protein
MLVQHSVLVRCESHVVTAVVPFLIVISLLEFTFLAFLILAGVVCIVQVWLIWQVG